MNSKAFKKILSILMVLMLVVVCAACGDTKVEQPANGAAELPDNSAQTSDKTEIAGFVPTEPIDIERAEYLSTVTYHSFLLTGESEPYFVGRWFDKEIDGEQHKVTVTAGSVVYFLIENSSSFSVDFTEITQKGEPYFAYSIDGGEPVRQLISQKTVNLPDSNRHTVRIIADGLNHGEDKWFGEIGFALKGITANGGSIVGIKPTEPVIFFYGDSITEGIRALSNEATPEGNSATGAFPWYCTEKLGAVPYTVGYASSGITQKGSFQNFVMTIDNFSKSRKADLETVIPSVIVVNHGTNDKVASDKFIERTKTALGQLRKYYPDTPIVYMIPLGQGHANDIRNIIAGFDNAYVVETAGWGVSFTDGLHPDAAGAKTAGEKLADELVKIFGEEFWDGK